MAFDQFSLNTSLDNLFSSLVFLVFVLLPFIDIYKTDRQHWYWKKFHPMIHKWYLLILIPLYFYWRFELIRMINTASAYLAEKGYVSASLAIFVVFSTDFLYWWVTRKRRSFAHLPIIWRLTVLSFRELFFIFPVSILISLAFSFFRCL